MLGQNSTGVSNTAGNILGLSVSTLLGILVRETAHSYPARPAFHNCPSRHLYTGFSELHPDNPTPPGKEKELVVAETVEEVKKAPALVCPPLRSRAYTPPSDLQSRLESHIKEVLGSSLPNNWQDISLDDGHVKFRLLANLADDLGHAVPNSRLHQMCRVRDVLDFYNVPVQDRSKFDELIASNLPPNLKISWNY
uniref:Large ribosomal subunit protein mL50 n=1 Tax=Rattus norvegicus TaxID=10116 RepID=A0A8I6AF38_RAT